jgi:flagellar basal body rod protein FlgG
MNRTTVVVLALAGVLAAFVRPVSAQNVTCTQAGDHRVICSNGQTFFQSGNMTYDTQGHVYTNLGNQTLDGQGDLYTRNGNQVFDNHGNAWDTVNGQQVGPDGRRCAQVGTQVFCGR